MVDRECKDDLPALVTKVSKRPLQQQQLQPRRTEANSSSRDSSSAAIIIRRSSKDSAKSEKPLRKLPFLEDYNEQKKAKAPYHCLTCHKKLARSSINSHVKTKHRGRPTKVKCGLCDRVFDKLSKAQDHVSEEHKVFACNHCDEAFSDFERLKAHLKASHESAEWPWICGFCDLVLFYELEFEVHIKQHTEKAPFPCPLCGRLFSDNSRLREHLARQHLPSRDSSSGNSSHAQIKFERQQAQLQQQQIEAFEKLKSAASAAMTDSKSKAAVAAMKDEAAVSRELAALLLNLHDSNRSIPKAEDLSLKASVETAIDLTKAKPEITLTPTMPASITKMVKGQQQQQACSAADISSASSSGVTVTKTSVKAPNYPSPASSAASVVTSGVTSTNGLSSNSYPFYPHSLAASIPSLSPTIAMSSNYLLHNLLMGKFQQLANNSSPTSMSSATTAASNSMALPTQPLPAQTLSLPASKPPASVLKTAASTPTSSSLTNSSYNLQLLPEATNSAASNGSSSSNGAIDIPYMCRQIVTLLNGLLFHQHNLNNQGVEMQVHTQLGAIYARLQEVVVMVEQAKKQQEAAAAASVMSKKDGGSNDKHLKAANCSSKKASVEEEKIAKQLEEYQKALLLKGKMEASESMASLLKKQPNLESVIQQQVDIVDSMEDAEMVASAAATLKNRRRGRPPKNSNLDLSYSPPEKKMRHDQSQPHSQQQPESTNGILQYGGSNGDAATVAAVAAAAVAAAASNGGGHLNGSSGGGGGKSGKGIRNRVFCGECTGCLKNDDCGKCRYCKDKTKFGGQNRLRQKCLHRRCQLDTHRRRSSQNNLVASNAAGASSVGSNGSFSENVHGSGIVRQSPSPDAIYSGVALARLASQQQSLVIEAASKVTRKDEQLSPGEIIRRSGQPAFPQAQHRSSFSEEDVRPGESRHNEFQPQPQSRSQQRSGSSASNASDEDADGDHKGRTQSRIDKWNKWKAKHEAMLKKASAEKEQEKKKAESPSVSSEDENVDIKANTNGVCLGIGPKPPVAAPAALSVQ